MKTMPASKAAFLLALAALSKVAMEATASSQQIQDIRVLALEGKVKALRKRLFDSYAQVAFSVRFSADHAKDGLPLHANQILKFDKVITNIGNHYNNRTGVFVAPVAGVYVFFLTQMASENHGNVYLDVMKERGVILDRTFSNGGRTDQGSTQVTTYLSAGQQVWVRNAQGTAVRGGWWTVFTGYLVQKDWLNA